MVLVINMQVLTICIFLIMDLAVNCVICIIRIIATMICFIYLTYVDLELILAS